VSANERPVSRGAATLSIALALLPVARMARIVFTYGENNLSNDYIARVPVVAAILEGRYDFRHLFTDTFIAYGHSWLAILPIYLFDARFFAWSMDAELGIGLLLAAAKTLLLWLAVAPTLSARARWLVLPVLSALAFSVSHVTSFTFGESTLQMQLPQLGLAIGACALARFGRRPNARCALVAAGGLLASWSWGGGVMVWPVFFAALLALGERSLRRWSVLGLAAATGMSQYALYAAFGHTLSAIERPGLSEPWRYIGLIGRPFANGTGSDFAPLRSALAFGAVGLLLAGGLLAVERRRWRARVPAMTVLGWSLLVTLEIGFFRKDVTAWYIVPMTAFWLGLAALLASAPRPIAAAGFVTIAAGLLYSNRTWEDKSFYLSSRAPVSAACLREWRTAPPECHARVFQWGGGHSGELALLGDPLERRRLSVFGPRRTYLLQGDVPLGRVRLDPESAPSILSADGRTPGDIAGFRRLDLVLAPGSTVSWRVDLPPGTRTARFRSVVRTDSDEALDARGAAISASAGPDGPTIASRVFLPRGEERDLVLDLSRFAGRTVNLSLGAEETQTPGSPLLWEAPRVDLALERTK
jgi:hypothetical protein